MASLLLITSVQAQSRPAASEDRFLAGVDSKVNSSVLPDMERPQGAPPPISPELQHKGNMGTQDQRIAQMTFASVYPMYAAEVEKKGRTKKKETMVST